MRAEAAVRRPTQFWLLVLPAAALAMWFIVGFPWYHHNESYIWAIELPRAGLWQVLFTNPVSVAGSYRPLGMLPAWLSLHFTDGAIWPAQLFNFATSALAWILAVRAAPNRFEFAWISALLVGGFFTGYIYLFHLHGVFYGPLLLFTVYLLAQDHREATLTWRHAGVLFLVAVAASLAHTFALLFLCAYLGGLWIDNRLRRQDGKLLAAIVFIAASVAIVWLEIPSADKFNNESRIGGFVTSFALLEVNVLLRVLAAALVCLTAWFASPQAGRRRMALAVTAVAAIAFWRLGLPIVLLWVLVCLARCCVERRMGLAAIIAACAVLPVATATGSPTYAIFVLLPCAWLVALEPMVPVDVARIAQPVAPLAVVAMIVVADLLRLGVPIPVMSPLVVPLQAEREKTWQMKALLDWISANPDVHGHLVLCRPPEYPVNDDAAMDRRRKPPMGSREFGIHVRSRFPGRFEVPSPLLKLCFGDETIEGAEKVFSSPAPHAGEAAVYRVP